MRSKPNSCSGCPCHSHGTDFSEVAGQCSLKVMAIAEASGKQEAREQVPLVPYAPAGSLFERTLRRMSLSREQFAVTNILRCRPRNNYLSGAPWEYSAIRHCKPNLDAAIDKYRPLCLFAMGDLPLRELTGLAGDAQGISHLRGYVLPSTYRLDGGIAEPLRITCDSCGGTDPQCFICNGRGYLTEDTPEVSDNIPLVASWHPAFIRRGKAAYQGMFARDLHQAVLVARGQRKDWIWNVQGALDNGTLRYSLHPSLDEAGAFAGRVLDNPRTVVSFDIETYESASLDEDARDGFTDTHLRLIQFSLGANEGIAFPWENGYRRIAERILQGPNVKVGHNVWLFDNKVLEAVGAREGLDLMPRGMVHDTLQMFHHWQPDLPAHLQAATSFCNFPFPWKHLAGSDLELYGCVDVDATWRLYAMLTGTLRRDQILGESGTPYGYLGQVADVRPVLEAMERRGLPIDDERRLALDGEFRKVQEELDGELQLQFPDVCRTVAPRRGKSGNYSYGYINPPKDCSKLVLREFREPGVDAEGNPVMVGVERWCRLEPFLPNSGPQLIAYMKHKGHKVPKSTKEEDADGNAKDTTEKKELRRLAKATGDGFYLTVIECRELGKARSTYVEGFKPHRDSKVHTTFTFDTGTGQLSSRNPCIQNFPKHGRLAKPLRAMVAAPTGMILTEWDFKSYHVLTTGFEAESERYMRMARLDMHSFVAGCFLKLWQPRVMEESDESLLDQFAWLKANPDWKRVRDKQAKPSILGIGFGMGKRRLYQENLESFPDERTAGTFIDLLHDLFPEVICTCPKMERERGCRAWQHTIRLKAHQGQCLVSRFGSIRRFWEVFVWDTRQGGMKKGDQAEEAVAFLPANHAFGNIREAMKKLRRRGLDEKYGLNNNIHDSLCWCFPERLLDEHIAEIHPVLTAPSKVLVHPKLAPRGLVVDVELSVGRSWAEMRGVELTSLPELEKK